MKFDVECVRNCLIKNRAVFTVRSYKYNSEWSRFEAEWIKRSLIKEVKRKEDLVNFVNLSGFNSIDEWWDKVINFCGKKTKYLYLVVLRNSI